jgi:hypothetical protein
MRAGHRPLAPALAVLAALAAAPAAAQPVFRCTSPDGKVTYQQAPCPKTDQERKVDATPANTDFDPAQRDELLRKGEEAGRRLEERAAREAEEARLRREKEERLEREALEREAARDEPVVVYGGRLNRPVQPTPPRPRPPQPAPRPAPATGR